MTPQAHLGRGVNPNRHRPAVLVWRQSANLKHLHRLFGVALKAMPNTPTKGTQGLVQVAAFVDPALREHLRELGGGNVSLGLRLAITQPGTTPSGAIWIGHECQFQPTRHNNGPSVLSMPEGVLAIGVGPSNLLIDAEASQIAFLCGDDGATADIELGDLAVLAARLGPAVMACCAAAQIGPITQNAGPIRVSRLSPGLIELAPAGDAESPDCGVVMPAAFAMQFWAEVVALVARRVEQHRVQVAGLNNIVAEPVVQP